MANQSDSLIANLISSSAEKIVQYKIKKLDSDPLVVTDTDKIMDQNISDCVENDDKEDEQMKNEIKTESFDSIVYLPCFILSRFVSLIGHITLKQLVYMESSVLSELNRRDGLKTNPHTKQKGKSRKSSQSVKVGCLFYYIVQLFIY